MYSISNIHQRTKFIILSGLISLLSTNTFAADNSRPDSHAPISVMADHKHSEGEVMFSYRFMQMEMEGNRNGSDELSNSEILAGPNNSGNHIVVPVDMSMTMHMFGVMYAPNNDLTLMLGLPFVEKTMDHLIAPDHMANPGTIFTTESSSLGDIKLGAIFSIQEQADSTLLASMALSVPTGSIDEKDEIASAPMLGETQIPFPMQIGSGTYDLMPSLTYTQFFESRSWGSQLSSVIRTGENDNGYTLGNRLQAQAWHAWVLSRAVSVSTRLNLQAWGNIDGDDNKRTLPLVAMNGRNTVQTVNPNNQGGKRADFSLGLNTLLGEQKHRIAAEITMPFYQNLDGPQMQSDMAFTLGYQKSF